jgi:hypothetical protein
MQRRKRGGTSRTDVALSALEAIGARCRVLYAAGGQVVIHAHRQGVDVSIVTPEIDCHIAQGLFMARDQILRLEKIECR